MKIKVGVSNRHIHLSEEDFNYLFPDSEFYSIRDLSQKGEFASNLTVNIKTDKNVIKNVRVVGPFREKSLAEISITDSYFLGIKPSIRMSNNFSNNPTNVFITSDDIHNLEIPCIVANRHIHVNTKDLDKYNFYEGKKVSVKVGGVRGGILDNVIIKAKDSFELELHIDTDEANAFNLVNGDTVTLVEEEE